MCGSGQVAGVAGGGAVTQGAMPVQMPTQTATQVAGASGAGVHQHGAVTQGGGAAGAEHAHGAEPKIPPKNSPVIQKYLADGSYGPTVKKGKAKTIQIPDGEGFGGVKGRKQNGNDKKQNNYSVTDANFYPALGVLNDAKTGKPLNYVKQIQAYNAAGYISTFHPDVYAKMVKAQDAGQGTVLGMALNMMGVEGAQTDPGMASAGLTAGQFANETVPGSPMNARKIVMSGKDIAGEEWARPHHAESSWGVYKALTDKGLDWKTSMVLSGDDAISGSGRLNGFNNQDGKDGFNDDEAAVFRMAAVVQQSTGVPAVDIVAGGHSHTGLDASAKTKPNINKLIGLNHGDTSSSPQRMAAIQKALLDGTIKGGNAKKFAVDDKLAWKGAGGNSQVLQYAISQVAGAHGGEKVKAEKGKFDVDPKQAAGGGGAGAGTVGGGAGAPDVAAGGGCSSDPKAGASLIGGGPADQGQIAAVLQQLIQTINALVAALSATSVAGATGGGAPGKPVQQTAPVPLPAPVQTQQTSTQQHDSMAHSH